MRLAERLSRIQPSATLAINAKTQELRAAGRQVVSLAVGEPDFPTPVITSYSIHYTKLYEGWL